MEGLKPGRYTDNNKLLLHEKTCKAALKSVVRTPSNEIAINSFTRRHRIL